MIIYAQGRLKGCKVLFSIKSYEADTLIEISNLAFSNSLWVKHAIDETNSQSLNLQAVSRTGFQQQTTTPSKNLVWNEFGIKV